MSLATRFTRFEEATQEFIDGLAQSNPSLRATGRLKNTKLSGRKGLVATLNNVSEVTGRGETVTVFTTLLRDGNLFYCIAVAPQDEYQAIPAIVPERGAVDPPERLSPRGCAVACGVVS